MARMRLRPLAELCRRVGVSFRAGVDMRRIWRDETRRGPAAQRAAAARIAERVAAGDSLAEAMRSCGGVFPPLVCDVVEVGEQTGRLEQALLQLADHYDHLLRLRRTFLLAIAWPAIELALAVAVVGLLIWALGIVSSITGRPSADVLGIGLTGARGAAVFFAAAGLAAAAIILPAAAVLQGRTPPAVMALILRVPGLGNALQTLCLARFAWSLAMALEAGMDARRSLRLALRSTHNPYYTSRADEADRVVARGGELHEAMRAAAVFPDEFVDAVQAADLAGTHTESLARLSDDYEQRSVAASKLLATIAAFAVWGLVALILIGLIFRLFFVLYYKPYQEAWDFYNSVY